MSASMSIRLSVYMFICMEYLGSHWEDIHEICYSSFLKKIYQEGSIFMKI